LHGERRRVDPKERPRRGVGGGAVEDPRVARRRRDLGGNVAYLLLTTVSSPVAASTRITLSSSLRDPMFVIQTYFPAAAIPCGSPTPVSE